MRARSGINAGLSLVELLVSLGVIALVMALSLPAVNAARASAQRTTCMNHLRQLGLGLLTHHAAHGAFPPGGMEWRPPGNTTNRQHAWSGLLLPFIEQQALFDQIDFSLPYDAPENATAGAAILPIFLCPTNRRGATDLDGLGPCDYGAIYGERITSPNRPPKGLMIYDRPLSLKDAPDGASKTALLGEDTRWSDGQWINGRNVFDQAYRVNAAPPFENDLRSDHGGGAYTVLADGALRWMEDAMDLALLASYCTRAGRDPDPLHVPAP
jgi:hypothetical protein